MTQTPLDITGTVTKLLRLPLTDDTREALSSQGVAAPEFVTLHLRAATLREREQFEQRQKDPPTTTEATYEWVAQLLQRRATTGTDPRVLKELAKDLMPSQIAQLSYAYIDGEAIDDPKVQAGLAHLVTRQTTAMARPVLEHLASAAPSLSSPTSTASDPGRSSD